MMRPFYFWGIPFPRRTFTLWDTAYGTWYTLWNPVAGGTVENCQYGIGRLDVPLAGIDRNGDGYSEMVVYRGQDVASNGFAYFMNSTPGAGCGGPWANRSYAAVNRIRTRAVAVADMTGDGKAEILFVQPDTMTVYWATSESDYQTLLGPRVVGNQRGVVF